jgi:hypothetical protein
MRRTFVAVARTSSIVRTTSAAQRMTSAALRTRSSFRRTRSADVRRVSVAVRTMLTEQPVIPCEHFSTGLRDSRATLNFARFRCITLA